ncbi:MAG TPA: hypothetical protein VJT15_15040 [Pyrinomonadaceae bacterium]|nr:hypothetical protein [Pyrinomonadaceae bacterium]
MADDFKRELTDQQLTELMTAGGKMAASMRAVLAVSSERMERLHEVNSTIRASGARMSGEARTAVSASLNAVSASLKALQASLRVAEAEVAETTGAFGSGQ